MTASQWKTGRQAARFTQVEAARRLGISQAYLSQLEQGLRVAAESLARKAIKLYKLSPTALPLRSEGWEQAQPERLQQQLAGLGYPGFAHIQSGEKSNPAEVVLSILAQMDLDTRLVEAVPWVIAAYPDLDWPWLLDQAKLRNLQNRLGYVLHLARQLAAFRPERDSLVQQLSTWEQHLEQARLAAEGTLCRDSMPPREREWLRTCRPEAAAHWNLLTGITADQLTHAKG